MGGIVEILSVVTERGDAVVVNSPVYTPFYRFVEHMERRVIEAPLSATHRIDADALDRAFTAATAEGRGAAFLLCSPHNPTGTVPHTRRTADGGRIGAGARCAGARDEIHAPIVAAASEHVPYLSLAGTEHAFALLSASKGWNLAGLKAALAVAGVERRRISHGCPRRCVTVQATSA